MTSHDLPDPPDLREQLRQAEEEVERLRRLARCSREPNKGLGGAIQRGREARGWGVRELARQAKVNATSLSNAERCEIPNLTLHILLRIAAALEMPLAKLLESCEGRDETFSRVLTVTDGRNGPDGLDGL